MRLEELGIKQPPIDQEKYKELSARSIHASPHTKPNEYNRGHVPILGSVFQGDGLERGLFELARLSCLATFFGQNYSNSLVVQNGLLINTLCLSQKA